MTTPINSQHLVYAPSAHPLRGGSGHKLERLLRMVGQDCGTTVRITSGFRTPHEQWRARMDYLNHGGALAAPCCSILNAHAWKACRRECQSNHCRSRAADCEIRTSAGDWVNIGELHAARVAMRRVGLCCPVGAGETWHVEVGDTWRS